MSVDCDGSMSRGQALLAGVEAAAASVFQELGPGHMEKPYANALAVALREEGGWGVAQEVAIPILYKTTPVGVCYADIVLVDLPAPTGPAAVIEVKKSGQGGAAARCPAVHEAQARKYQDLVGAGAGFVVMFGLAGACVYAVKTQ